MTVVVCAVVISVTQIRFSSLMMGHTNANGSREQGLSGSLPLAPGLTIWRNDAIDRFKRMNPKIEDQDVMPFESQSFQRSGSDDEQPQQGEERQWQETEIDDRQKNPVGQTQSEVEVDSQIENNVAAQQQQQQQQQPETTIKVSPRKPKATIAYAIAVTECSHNDAHVMYGASVLAESIKNLSIRRNANASYDYSLYAFVHDDARECNAPLYSLGYHVLNGKSPLHEVDKEYIKTYALSLSNHRIVVTLEVDTLLLQPLDELFDFILEGKVGSDLAHGGRNYTGIHPDQIQFVSTKTADRLVDHSFFIARTSSDAYPNALERMKAYPGKSFDDFLNHVYGEEDHVELDSCVYNTYLLGNHENDNDECKDTPFEKIKFAHFSSCGAPWDCQEMEKGELCQRLHKEWHRNRKLLDETLQNERPNPDSGLPNSFGYCKRVGEFEPVKIVIVNQEE